MGIRYSGYRGIGDTVFRFQEPKNNRFLVPRWPYAWSGFNQNRDAHYIYSDTAGPTLTTGWIYQGNAADANWNIYVNGVSVCTFIE